MIAALVSSAGLTVSLGLALLVCWWWRPRRAAEPSVWILLICYAALGAWALWFGLYAMPWHGPEGFKFWKPTLLYWLLAGILLVVPALGLGYPIKVILGTYFTVSGREWRWINLGAGLLLVLVGAMNLLVAFTISEDEWTGIKYSCMVLLFFVFMFRLTFVWVDTVVRIVTYWVGRAKAHFP